jgi:hypothetical protein
MESDIQQTSIYSQYFDKQQFHKQIDIIKKASELAQSKIDYASAHNDNILRAIDIVEEFLKNTHRICYGGQAINAHLPEKYKFYDPATTIPDYDFFTPSQKSDINHLVGQLKLAGFKEISIREAMHEGTIKLYVDYVPVADITSIHPSLFKLLSKREYKLDGISYLDANTLRMLMYLELSRPRGEVSRWTKVFERLSLFNEFVSVKACIGYDALLKADKATRLSKHQLQHILEFIINNNRIFAGADLLNFYKSNFKNKKSKRKLSGISWILSPKKPVLFLSSDVDDDVKKLQNELQLIMDIDKNKDISTDTRIRLSIKSVESNNKELVPYIKCIVQNNIPLVFIIDQIGCQSYFNVKLDKIRVMRIATLDVLITLYFSLGISDSKLFNMGSMECLANKLVELSIKTRNKPDNFAFPFISIKCVGHQPTFSSLIRERVKRHTQGKKQLKNIMMRSTIRRSRSR